MAGEKPAAVAKPPLADRAAQERARIARDRAHKRELAEAQAKAQRLADIEKAAESGDYDSLLKAFGKSPVDVAKFLIARAKGDAEKSDVDKLREELAAKEREKEEKAQTDALEKTRAGKRERAKSEIAKLIDSKKDGDFEMLSILDADPETQGEGTEAVYQTIAMHWEKSLQETGEGEMLSFEDAAARCEAVLLRDFQRKSVAKKVQAAAAPPPQPSAAAPAAPAVPVANAPAAPPSAGTQPPPKSAPQPSGHPAPPTLSSAVSGAAKVPEQSAPRSTTVGFHSDTEEAIQRATAKYNEAMAIKKAGGKLPGIAGRDAE